MEILLDKRSLRQIRQSVTDAVQDGDTETLREDVMDAFNEEQIEEIERRIDSGDFYDFLGDALDEWGGDDVEELFELLETHLSDVGIELKYANPALSDDDDEDEDDDDFSPRLGSNDEEEEDENEGFEVSEGDPDEL